jgi:hypothetical protein
MVTGRRKEFFPMWGWLLAISAFHSLAEHRVWQTLVTAPRNLFAGSVLNLDFVPAEYPLVGASVGYFSLLILCAGWALSRLLGPSAIVYSPRVLPVFTFDPELDRAIDRSMAFLVLYLVALGTAAWGVLASVWITPSYAGSAVCSLTLVIAYAFAESRPRMTVKVGF